MLPEDRKWFTEVCAEAGSAGSWSIEEHLAHEKTAFQTIDVYRTSHWGNLMVIDGFVMLTSRDNFLYHEMLSHPALYSHPAPKQVVIIGGGDCGTLREVLRHPEVGSATQVEIDERVTRLSEIHFPELCDSNDDPRACLLFADGLEYVDRLEPGSVDVIIVDSTDPIGPAKGLFGPAFVANCCRALGSDGILIQQSESPLYHPHLIAGIRQNMEKTGFGDIRTLGFPQPCYPSGWWSATMARKSGSLDEYRKEAIRQRPFPTHYYNAEIHQAALAVPVFMQAL